MDFFKKHTSNPTIVKGTKVKTAMNWPAIVLDNRKNQTTRLCEVWGIEHESGSVYADELTPISDAEFEALKKKLGH